MTAQVKINTDGKSNQNKQGVNGNVPVPHTSCPVPGTENDISQCVVLDRPHPRDDLRFPIHWVNL
jgi:hypothetical protein